MKQILFIFIIFIHIFENMAMHENRGESSQRSSAHSSNENEAESKNSEMNPKNTEEIVPDSFNIFNSFDPNQIEKRKRNNSSNFVPHRPVTRSQTAKEEGFNFAELGHSKFEKPQSKKAKTFHQQIPQLQQKQRKEQRNLGQHSAPGIGQGSSSSALIPAGQYQQKIQGHMPNLFGLPNETDFFAQMIDPHNNEEERKSLKEIEENLLKLYETKEKLKNLGNKLDKHDKFVTETENANNLDEMVIKELEKTKTDYFNKEEEVEQQIEEMNKQKQQITQKIQEKVREKLKAGKGNH